MQEGAENATQDDLPVLKVIDPCVVKDGDELDDIGSIKGTQSDDTTKPTGLKDQDHHGVGEVAKEGHSDGAEGEGCHPDVRHQGNDGAHVGLHLEKAAGPKIEV